MTLGNSHESSEQRSATFDPRRNDFPRDCDCDVRIGHRLHDCQAPVYGEIPRLRLADARQLVRTEITYMRVHDLGDYSERQELRALMRLQSSGDGAPLADLADWLDSLALSSERDSEGESTLALRAAVATLSAYHGDKFAIGALASSQIAGGASDESVLSAALAGDAEARRELRRRAIATHRDGREINRAPRPRRTRAQYQARQLAARSERRERRQIMRDYDHGLIEVDAALEALDIPRIAGGCDTPNGPTVQDGVATGLDIWRDGKTDHATLVTYTFIATALINGDYSDVEFDADRYSDDAMLKLARTLANEWGSEGWEFVGCDDGSYFGAPDDLHRDIHNGDRGRVTAYHLIRIPTRLSAWHEIKGRCDDCGAPRGMRCRGFCHNPRRSTPDN